MQAQFRELFSKKALFGKYFNDECHPEADPATLIYVNSVRSDINPG